MALALLLTACQGAPTAPRVQMAPVSTAAGPATAAPPPPARPAGPPRGPGGIQQLLAVDDQRAVVVFVPEATFGEPAPTLALMHRDGRIGWSVTLDHPLFETRTSPGVELVGDAVVVTLAEWPPSREEYAMYETVAGIQVHALDDGHRRARIDAGKWAYGRETVVDGDERYDVVTSDTGGDPFLIASGPQGERWRTKLHDRAAGDEILMLPEHVAVSAYGGMAAPDSWFLYRRDDGRRVGSIEGQDETCTDGRRWFLWQKDALVEARPSDLSTRLISKVTLPGGSSRTTRGCTIIDGEPIAFIQQGMTEGLVSIAPDGSTRHAMSLGLRRLRSGRVYPLPNRLHPVVATLSESEDDFVELGVSDLRRAGATFGRGPKTYAGAQGLIRRDDGSGGYVVAARSVIATIDGDTGQLVGRALRRDTMAFHRSQLRGSHLWLPPPSPMRLGQAAPTVLDLRDPAAPEPDVDQATRDAFRAMPRIQCSALSTSGHDGIGTSEALPPPPKHGRLPAWDLDLLASGARHFACADANAEVTLLAWSIETDDRPLRNHNALVLVETRVNGAPIYTAVAMYRHATNKSWNVSRGYHSRSRPVRRFAHRPTTADLDAFVAQSKFQYVSGYGRVVRGNVLDDHWRRATGEKPTLHFAAAIEQAD